MAMETTFRKGDSALWTPHSWTRRGVLPKILVKVIDERVAYGRQEYLIEPVTGEGRTWVQTPALEATEVLTIDPS